jgi:hypothetical protein
MRDGIPRSLPVSRKFRAFVECADRPADRGTPRVIERLREAIHDAMQREFPIAICQQLQNAFFGHTEPSIPGLEFAGAPSVQLATMRGHSYRLAELLKEE